MTDLRVFESKAAEDLVGHHDARIPDGFPCVVDIDGKPVDAINDYLLDAYFVSCSVSSLKTLRTYAEHLADWFATLSRNRLTWSYARSSDLVSYRSALLRPTGINGKSLATTTINDRLSCVIRHYRWANTRNISLSKSMLTLISSDNSRTGLYVSPKRRTLLVKKYQYLPRAINPDHLDDLLKNLNNPYRLIALWALYSGARRGEIAMLRTGDIFSASVEVQVLCELEVKTKGGGYRTLYVPNTIVSKTKRYMAELSAKNPNFPLDGAGLLWRNRFGQTITPAAITSAFYRARVASKFPRRVRFHDLRHTYAINTLRSLYVIAKAKPIAPLKMLQRLLGHRSIESTMIYIKSIEEDPSTLNEALGFLNGEVLEGMVSEGA
ncbi:site-specific integrase [Wenzhouxiangella sp. AB-CW3]|uniref:tyrosine-type recombinase/integrase n=1 Tax=Wenzhouxiangella sp. AB-CW3 TaxID=2771012 RepID=UPI00168A6589|nr:site-specific integrase [Wenzhouxiangella sp. AB-CW3]QOC22244.1 site-specific integrase [Wenzhouxiangella sp. AB-CW3]